MNGNRNNRLWLPRWRLWRYVSATFGDPLNLSHTHVIMRLLKSQQHRRTISSNITCKAVLHGNSFGVHMATFEASGILYWRIASWVECLDGVPVFWFNRAENSACGVKLQNSPTELSTFLKHFREHWHDGTIDYHSNQPWIRWRINL